MSQFYVTDEQSARIAREGIIHRNLVSMTGTIGTGIRSFTGVAQSVEEDKAASRLAPAQSPGAAVVGAQTSGWFWRPVLWPLSYAPSGFGTDCWN
jgi:hypothetical protein